MGVGVKGGVGVFPYVSKVGKAGLSHLTVLKGR